MGLLIASLLAVIAVAVVVIVALAARRPDRFEIRRTLVIPVEPARLYPLLEDFVRWQQWSPWEGRDPAMQRTYAGAARGPGAVYEWRGNRAVGSGRMQITAADPDRRVVIALDFITPIKASNETVFTLFPAADGATTVSWTMTGRMRLFNKVFDMLFGMEKMVGPDFEKGLQQLRDAATAP